MTLNRRTLVINRNYQAITTITVKKAIILVWKEVATIVTPPVSKHDTWNEYDWDSWSLLDADETDAHNSIRAPHRSFRVPEIIKLNSYGGIPQRKIKLSRRAVYTRDNHICQYCGEQPDWGDFTLDHVLPRSRGGVTNWSNVVLSCSKCNRKKADRTPKEAGMKLLSIPKIPDFDVLQGRDMQYDSWSHFLEAN